MQVKFAVSLVLLLTAGGISALAQDLTIDDFTTGPFKQAPVRCGKVGPSSQNGIMLGGNRSTGLLLSEPSACGFAQPNSYEFKPASKSTPSAMLFNAGYGAAPRIDMGYGFGPPMSVNFTPYDRIRVNFLGLTQPLNFNIQLFTGTTWAQNGCNISALNRPFSIELPFTGFIISGPTFSWSNINLMNTIFQSGSAIGGVDLAVSSIQLSNTPMQGSQICNLQ